MISMLEWKRSKWLGDEIIVKSSDFRMQSVKREAVVGKLISDEMVECEQLLKFRFHFYWPC
jgi:hypothetical protein